MVDEVRQKRTLMKIVGGQRGAFLTTLAAASFLLNFCWESLHGLLYEGHPEMAASAYVPMMLLAALMDTFAIAVIYFLTALFARVWFWDQGLRNRLFFLFTALFAASLLEYVSINSLHLWHYRPSMPVLFGIGLFPLVQLSLTGLFSLFVARKVAG